MDAALGEPTNLNEPCLINEQNSILGSSDLLTLGQIRNYDEPFMACNSGSSSEAALLSTLTECGEVSSKNYCGRGEGQ